jgi:hypothetical protein
MSFRDTLPKLLSGAQPGAEKTKLGRGSNTSLGHGFVAVCNNCGGAGRIIAAPVDSAAAMCLTRPPATRAGRHFSETNFFF